MKKAISIYPNDEENYLTKCEEYIKLANKYNFTSVFTSLHLPEIDISSQVLFLYDLSKLVKKYDMELIADIGGKSIKEIIKKDDLLNKLKDVDVFRLDYGYDHEDIKYLHDTLNNHGFMINASIYNFEESKREVEFLRSLNTEVIACHNFYPRVESGIDEDFALKQKLIFDSLNVPIYYWIPSHINPRGPIYDGLPTLEIHRYLSIKPITQDLVNRFNADGVMTSDNFYSEEELKTISDNCSPLENPIEIKVNTINDKYDDIIFKTHEFRYDSSSSFLRSKSSRTMAEFASIIEPENCIERKAGVITIDNKKNERYSGELQVVLVNHKDDEKVNVVGYINDEDLYKLKFFINGYKYKFIK